MNNPILLGQLTPDSDFTGSERAQAPARPLPIMKFFEFEHLPPKLQATSRPFCELAHHLESALPDGPEKTVALRKLLESKDAGVRAALG